MPEPTLPPNDPKHPKPKAVEVQDDENLIVPESPEQEDQE